MSAEATQEAVLEHFGDLDLLIGTDFRNSMLFLEDEGWVNKDLRHLKISNVFFAECSFRHVDFRGAVFSDCRFTNCTFLSCGLEGARFHNCDVDEETNLSMARDDNNRRVK